MNTNIIYIKRDIEKDVRKYLNHGKVIVVYGARQVGKTTFLKTYLQKKTKLYIFPVIS